MGQPAKYDQYSFRWRYDDGTESGASWKRALNTNMVVGAGRKVRLRIEVENYGGQAGDLTAILMVSRNSGAYSAVTEATSYVRSAESDATFTDEDPTTDQLTGAGTSGTDNGTTFVAGKCDDADGTGGSCGAVTITNAYHTEYEFTLEFVDGDVAEADTYDFRIYDSGPTALDAYTQTPRATVVTTTTHVVDTGGTGDYSSLNAWEAAQQADLPTAAAIKVAKCQTTDASADTTAVTIDGWTTDDECYIKIWTDPAESYRHNGKWNSSKYRMDVAGDCMEILEDYVQVVGLQFDASGATATTDVVRVDTGTGSNKIEIVKCIFKAIATGGGGVIEGGVHVDEMAAAASNVYIANCVFFDIRNSDYPNSDVHNGIWGEYGNTWAYNCTAFDCGTGFQNGSYNFVAMNCLSNCDAENANQTDFSGTFDSSSDYNASSDATAPDNGHSRTSQTFTFVDADNDDFHLDSSDAGAKTYGVDLSGDSAYPITDDIDGDTRSGTWDIGADEYTLAAAGGISQIIGGGFLGV